MSYLEPSRPRALAHRGGALLSLNLGIENTLEAFENAVALGFSYVETDVHCSRDGIVYAFHDADLTRLTGDPAPIEELDSDRVDDVLLDGRAGIPRLGDVLAALPTTRFNIDVKADGAVDRVVDVVRHAGATDRVLLASFSRKRLLRLRRIAPEIPTSGTPDEVFRIMIGLSVKGPVAVQVPEKRGLVRIVTPGFLRRAHRLGIEVHVWTIDTAEDMDRLLDMGVDGLVTDRPDVLREVLQSRGQWHGGR